MVGRKYLGIFGLDKPPYLYLGYLALGCGWGSVCLFIFDFLLVAQDFQKISLYGLDILSATDFFLVLPICKHSVLIMHESMQVRPLQTAVTVLLECLVRQSARNYS